MIQTFRKNDFSFEKWHEESCKFKCSEVSQSSISRHTFFDVSSFTPCCITPEGTAWLKGKMPNVQNFPEWDLVVNFPPGRKPTGDTTKPAGEDMKIQRGELMKILLWVKSIHTWFSLKHINGWVTFKCQKILQILSKKIALSVKSSLKV